jgi:protein TonB
MHMRLSSPERAIAPASSRSGAPAPRWPWLAGSLALHLLVVGLVIGFADRSRLAEPAAAPALEVEIVGSVQSAAAMAPSASLPDAPPAPAAAVPEPPPVPTPAVETVVANPVALPPAEPPPPPAAPPAAVEPLPPQVEAAVPPPPAAEPPPTPAVPPRTVTPARPRLAQVRPVPQRQERGATPAASVAAAPAQAAPGPDGVTPVAAVGARADWDRLVSAWIAAHQSYPEPARRRGDTGEVTLRFAVAADGRVTEVTVVDATGGRELADAAVAILTGATVPAPPAPAVRTVRIRYRLEN